MNVAELHEAIQKNTALRQRLRRINNGRNLISIGETAKPFKVVAQLKVRMNLRETDVSLSIDTNLPFAGWRDYDDAESFLKEFEEWATMPEYQPRHYNRRFAQLSDWELHDLKLRKNSIGFDDITIVVYPEAQKWLAHNGTPDLAQKIGEICTLQQQATPEQKRVVDRYIYLREQLKLSKEKIDSDDETIKLNDNKKKQNSKAKRLAAELQMLCETNPLIESRN